MRIGFVTDELSPDVNTAIETGLAWGIHDFELRMIGEHRVPHISPKIVEEILKLQERHGFRITALSPGVFKGTIQDQSVLDREIEEVLPQTFGLAKLFGTGLVITFGIQRSSGDRPEGEEAVVEIFRRATRAAEREGLVLAVENEPGFWCDDGTHTAGILARVDSPALRANWDPANAVGTQEKPYPHGYLAIKNWIANVHVKDTRRSALLECVPVGEGVVDWEGQMKALLKDRPVDHVTIETHCVPLLEKSRQNLQVVKKLLSLHHSP